MYLIEQELLLLTMHLQEQPQLYTDRKQSIDYQHLNEGSLKA